MGLLPHIRAEINIEAEELFCSRQKLEGPASLWWEAESCAPPLSSSLQNEVLRIPLAH